MSDETPTGQTPNDVPGAAEPQPSAAPPPYQPVPSASEPRSHVRRGAVLWGIALVIVGGLLLVSQFVPGIALWRYWPLIIVAIGVRQMLGPSAGHWSVKHAVDGLVTIAFGLVFLGQMLGYLGWDVWLNILKLWPLLLVSLGLEIAGKGLRSEWLRALGGVVIIAGLAYGSLVMTPTGTWVPFGFTTLQSESFAMDVPHDPAVDEGVAAIRAGLGRFSLEAGGDLATAEGRSPFEPRLDVETMDNSAVVDIRTEGTTWVPNVSDSELDVTLDRTVDWELDIDVGVANYDVDLSGLAITDLGFSAGVSEGTLTLGSAGKAGQKDAVRAEIEAGVSTLLVRVPEGESVRLRVSQGLSDVKVRGSWTSDRDGDERIWESDGFSQSGAYWDIDLTSGIGSVIVEYY